MDDRNIIIHPATQHMDHTDQRTTQIPRGFDITVIKKIIVNPHVEINDSPEDLKATLRSFGITIISKTTSRATNPKPGDRPLSSTRRSDFAFAFDIDGVIYKSGELCPGAKEAIAYLHTHSIPFILLTNGGGKTEEVRALDMAARLETPVDVSQFIQAHTPFKNQVSRLADNPVLVLGGVGNQCREVAESYGFRKVVTAADIITANPTIFPFNEIHADYFTSTARTLPSKGREAIAAIFIFSSPRDWGLDLQILTDLLLSQNGMLGTRSPKNGDVNLPNKGYLQDSQPHLFFSNPDYTYATNNEFPRICQGSLVLALKGIWKGLTGTELVDGVHYTQIGKPTQLQFEYGELTLREVACKNGMEMPKRVYMVGDGPRSDIRGANEYKSPWGSSWESILVQTGIHQAGKVPEFLPAMEVPNVQDAVSWALRREMVIQ